MAMPTFQLKSATTQTNAPFCHGQAFERGAVPAGSQVVANVTSFQYTPKNTWPDGSLKFAIVAGLADLTANVDRTITLSIGAPTAGTSVATTALSAATAAISTLGLGSASWATTAWNSPFVTWVAGPFMSSFIYRKQVGTDAHLVAWLEVRVWSTGAVEVLPWVENGYIRVAAPTNKNDTYAFTLGGTQRFSAAINLRHHTRQVLISGTALAYWLGTDPGVQFKHDTTYLQHTELVPTYSATPSQANIDALVTTYAPNSQGNINYDSDNMPGPGYQKPIGLLPLCDAVHLMAPSYSTTASVVRNGFVAGRYSSHYRDENTNKPLRFADYPNLVISDGQGYANNGSSTASDMTLPATGGANAGWDIAHSPALGYLAYLTTGRFYFMEEVQFVATGNYLSLGDNDTLRQGIKGLFQPAIGATATRAAAWGIRTLAHALTVTPDADTGLQTQFANSLKSNIDFFHGRFVAQPNNPFGFVTQDAAGYAGAALPPWMQDFFTAVVGWALCMGLPVPSTYQAKLYGLFNYVAKSIVGRLGAPTGGSGYPYMNADIYILSISPADAPDYAGGTGPWRASWAEVYSVAASTLAASGSPTGWITSDPTMMAGEEMPGATAMWGNLLPAIAYAERHGATGAAAARSRITSAANYSALAADLNNNPVWAVTPSGLTSNLGGGTLTTPGPSAVFDTTPLWGANTATFDVDQGLGTPLSKVPTGGTNSVSVIRALMQVGDNPASEARVRYISTPTGFAAGGDTSYTSPAGAITYEVYLDGVSLGQATDTVAATGSSTITGVTISPLAATINAGGTQQFVGTASGTGSFNAAVNYSVSGVAGATGGSINSSGLLTTTSLTTDRVFNVTATSAQDSSKSATTTITVLGVSGVILAPRFARPESDVSKGAWLPSTGTNLFAMIDEATADATDYIAATTPTTSRIKLGAVTDPNTSVNQVLRYQAWSPTGGSLTARLFCGGTQIATWTHLSLPTTPSLIAQVLTSSQCDAITDYTNLFVEFTAA